MVATHVALLEKVTKIKYDVMKLCESPTLQKGAASESCKTLTICADIAEKKLTEEISTIEKEIKTLENEIKECQ